MKPKNFTSHHYFFDTDDEMRNRARRWLANRPSTENPFMFPREAVKLITWRIKYWNLIVDFSTLTIFLLFDNKGVERLLRWVEKAFGLIGVFLVSVPIIAVAILVYAFYIIASPILWAVCPLFERRAIMRQYDIVSEEIEEILYRKRKK